MGMAGGCEGRRELPAQCRGIVGVGCGVRVGGAVRRGRVVRVGGAVRRVRMGGIGCGVGADRCWRRLGVGHARQRNTGVIDYHARPGIHRNLQPQGRMVGKQGAESRRRAERHGKFTVRDAHRGMGFRPQLRAGRGGVPEGKGHIINAVRHRRTPGSAQHALVGNEGRIRHRGAGHRGCDCQNTKHAKPVSMSEVHRKYLLGFLVFKHVSQSATW